MTNVTLLQCFIGMLHKTGLTVSFVNQIELKDCTDKYFQYASKMKNNKSALSDQLNNQISKSLKEGKSIPLTHKYSQPCFSDHLY
jgi:hypothetical protein